MIQVNRIYLIFNRLVTKKFLVDTSEKRCDVLSAPEQATGGLQAVDSLQWYVLGAVFASPYRNLLKLDLAKDGVVELDLLFAGGEPEIHSRMLKSPDRTSYC